MCIKKRSGPKIDPWMAPQFKIPASKKILSRETKNFLFDKTETI